MMIRRSVAPSKHTCSSPTRLQMKSDTFASAFSSTAPSLEDQSNNDLTFELFDTGTAFTKLNYSGKGMRK
jgi:hypothetical protein